MSEKEAKKEKEPVKNVERSPFEAFFEQCPKMDYQDNQGVKHTCAVLSGDVFNISLKNPKTEKTAVVEQVAYQFLMDQDSHVVRICLMWVDPFGNRHFSIFDRQVIYTQAGFEALLAPLVNKGCFMPLESAKHLQILLSNQAPLGLHTRVTASPEK